MVSYIMMSTTASISGSRRVKTLVDSEMEPGQHKVTWNGVDEWGRPVS
jgi:hypothetical protein